MSQNKEQPKYIQLPLWVNMSTGCLAAWTAEFFSLPLDTAKMRLQIQGEKISGNDQKKQYKGTIDLMRGVIRKEGLLSLWSGLIAGLQRQLVFASFRLGFYEPIRNYISFGKNPNETGLASKILAGLITGAIGMLLANPMDLVKIRLQGQGRVELSKRRYIGVFDAYKKIWIQEGFLSFWTGIIPNIMRNSIINATELATYDQTKQIILNYHLMNDNIWCHFASSAFAGLMATIIGSPIDVVKTRIMNANKVTGKSYKGIFDCIIKTYKDEGFFAFYRGFNANAQRIITWNIIMFVTLDKIRKYVTNKFYLD